MFRNLLLLSLPLLAVAETRTIVATHFFNSYDHRHEALPRIRPGDTIVTKTLDAGGYDEPTNKLGAGPGVFGPTSAISGNYGGNMDYNRVNEGATVILPVFHPGALLFIGDGHALQADGEPTGTGIETSLDVSFTVALRKRANVSNPRVETPEHIIAVGSQPEFVSSLDRSLRVATSEMVDWLVRDYKMEPWAAHMLIGYQGQYDVVTVAGSMALRLPRSSLPH